jgi:lipoprotein NlpI
VLKVGVFFVIKLVSKYVKRRTQPSVLLVSLVLLFLAGCVNTQNAPHQGHLDGLLLAEPEPIDPRVQLLIARYSQILNQPSLKKTERAELHYQRGVLYDGVGLRNLAGYDFTQAINLKPDLAPAYNSIGVHLTQNQEFDQAFEAFDSSLDIDPNFEFAMLNRGIALYYAGRSDLGIDDFERFLEKSPSDPFRVIWAFNAHLDVDPVKAKERLFQYRTEIDETHWALSIVDFYLGKASEDDVLNAVIEGVNTSQELTHRLCEAYFYLGKHHAFVGNYGVALSYFKLSLSTNVYEYVEHKYARIEMARIREAFDAQP